MNQANTLKLTNDFPRIFPQPFYFECGDGWFDLLYKTCTEIENECIKLGVKSDKWITASQVKEKYGTLRFYVNNYIDSIFSIIEAAEVKSSTTCEECGMPGSTKDNSGWIHTRCSVCEALSQQ